MPTQIWVQGNGGAIDGSGKVSINSPGVTVTLTGNNTYDLGTFVDAGTLLVNASSLAVKARPGGASCATPANPLDACVQAGASLGFSQLSDATWGGQIGGTGDVLYRSKDGSRMGNNFRDILWHDIQTGKTERFLTRRELMSITEKEAKAYMQTVYPRKDVDKYMLCVKMRPSELKLALELKEKKAAMNQ